MAYDENQPSPEFFRTEESVSLELIPLHSTNLLTVLDENGVIRYESPSIETIYGFDQEELVGDQVAEYFTRRTASGSSTRFGRSFPARRTKSRRSSTATSRPTEVTCGWNRLPPRIRFQADTTSSTHAISPIANAVSGT